MSQYFLTARWFTLALAGTQVPGLAHWFTLALAGTQVPGLAH
jgi:hypothetical protein